MRLKRKEVEKKYFFKSNYKHTIMNELFYFEIIEGAKVVFRSDYFSDEVLASKCVSEIVILMGKCAPTRMLSYRILSVKVVSGSVPDNYAL